MRQPAQSTTLTASALDPYLPKLALPDDPSTGQPAHSLGAGDSNGVMERRMSVSFRLDATAADVAAHFTRQMAEQGWRNEASWSSAGSAGSSWNRSGNDDEVLQATLTVAASMRAGSPSTSMWSRRNEGASHAVFHPRRPRPVRAHRPRAVATAMREPGQCRWPRVPGVAAT
ncbi:MAG: hypothetical protein WDO12_10300 [Pseudomonadota bacterium]